ncbi:hypothetical protein [Umezakia ovalisporum]
MKIGNKDYILVNEKEILAIVG